MNDAPVSRSNVRAVPIRTAFDVCAFVDELDPELAGELLIAHGGSTEGAVFVQHGRICWAAARGLARRLTELLVVRAGGDARTMEGYYKQCQSEGARWGEWLVDRGVLSPDDLRGALLDHTVESLEFLCRDADTSFWCPRAAGGYSPRFTFPTAELLSRAGAAAHADVARSIASELEACFFDGDWGAAFVRSETRAFPELIALQGAYPTAASSLVRAGKWASSTLDLAAVLQHDDPILSLDASASRSLVAFRHRGAVVVGETSVFGPARILNRRAQLRRTRE